jgi:flavin reductase (DIM6/NTAB) family NADH-FMN oxidoreductase RutF
MSNNGPQAAESSIEAREFRRVCSRFASGVTIVTVLDGNGALHGMTASSFTSVSLRPPLILVCVNSGSRILEAFRQSDHFGVNILHESQRRLSERFAGTGYDRFDGVTWHAGQTGTPLFPDVLAKIECRRVEIYPAGDHDILIGEVLHADCREGEPLVHFGSQYRGLEASPGWWSTL